MARFSCSPRLWGLFPAACGAATPPFFALTYVEQSLEAVIHVKLLMAVEQGQAGLLRSEIHFKLAKALHQHDVLHHTGGALAVNIGQLEKIAMQVHRMGVVGPVVEHQTVAAALL